MSTNSVSLTPLEQGDPSSQICVCDPLPKHTTHMALCHGLSHLTQTPLLTIPFPRTQTQTADTSHQGKVNKAKRRKGNRKDTGAGWASGSQPAGGGVTEMPAPLQAPYKKTSSPQGSCKAKQGPLSNLTPDSFAERKIRDQHVLQIVVVDVVS